MKIQPAKNIVVIKPAEVKGVVGSGIIEAVVEKEKNKPEIGEVIAIGKLKKKKELPIEGLKIGDIIAYRRYGESKFLLGSEEILFVSFDDCLGIIKKGKK